MSCVASVETHPPQEAVLPRSAVVVTIVVASSKCSDSLQVTNNRYKPSMQSVIKLTCFSLFRREAVIVVYISITIIDSRKATRQRCKKQFGDQSASEPLRSADTVTFLLSFSQLTKTTNKPHIRPWWLNALCIETYHLLICARRLLLPALLSICYETAERCRDDVTIPPLTFSYI